MCSGQTNYTALLNERGQAGLSPELALILAGSLLVGLLIVGFLWWKFREVCESVRLHPFLRFDSHPFENNTNRC